MRREYYERINKLITGMRTARDEAMRRARNALFYAGDHGASERTRQCFRETASEYVREARRLNRNAISAR